MTNSSSNRAGSDSVSLTPDKHFLPEWLEKYPVFGLEMKLAWRRFKRGRNLELILVQKVDRLRVKMINIIITIVMFSALLLVIIVPILFHSEIFADYPFNYEWFWQRWLDWLHPLSLLLFIFVPAIQGTGCYQTAGDYSFLRQIATTGIFAKRIASEILAAGVLKYLFLAIFLAMFLLVIDYHYEFQPNPYASFPTSLFLGYFILQICIYLVSSLFSTTRLSCTGKRFAVLSLWIIMAVVLILHEIWLNYKISTANDYVIHSALVTTLPLGSLVSYPIWARNSSIGMFTCYPNELKTIDQILAISSVFIQVLYSYLAYKLACKLFARRLSE